MRLYLAESPESSVLDSVSLSLKSAHGAISMVVAQKEDSIAFGKVLRSSPTPRRAHHLRNLLQAKMTEPVSNGFSSAANAPTTVKTGFATRENVAAAVSLTTDELAMVKNTDIRAT